MTNDKPQIPNSKTLNDESPSAIAPQTARPSRAPFTVEAILWTLVAVGALGLRLMRLGVAPLNGPEARAALLAWRAVTGQGRTLIVRPMPEAGAYSPFLFAANALLFVLFDAGDALARLWPALFGGALTLTPLLFRRRVGRVGALGAGVYLALSPTALLASRQLDGAVVAAAGLMAALGGVVRFRDTGGRKWLALSAVGLALALTSSSAAYGLALAPLLAWLILRIAWPASAAADPAQIVAQHALYVAPVFLGAALALSTGLGWNAGGLGAAGDLLSSWAARFAPVSEPVASPLILVAVYEPLGLLFGLGGLIWGLRRGRLPQALPQDYKQRSLPQPYEQRSLPQAYKQRSRWEAFLGLWAGMGLLLLFLTPGRSTLDLLWGVLPLALLAGVAVNALVHELQDRGEWLSEGLYALIVVILWTNLYLMLARYASAGDMVNLAVAVLALVLQILLALVFALTVGGGAALRALAASTGLVLLMGTLSVGWGVAHVRPADPRELLVREPTASGVHDLVHTLRDLSWRETGMPTALPFTVVVDSASHPAPEILAWYLRDFDAVHYVESPRAIQGGRPSVLVTAGRELEGLGDAASEYMGQDFVLRRRWDLSQVGCVWTGDQIACAEGVKWWLFRDTVPSPAADRWAALWLRE